MIRPAQCLLLILILASVAALPSPAQGPATGTPPFGSYAGGPDVINLGNLNSHIAIGVLHKPGRGTSFDYDLSSDTSVWYPGTSGGVTTWQPVANWGWTGQTQIATGYIAYTKLNGDCGTGNGRLPYSIYTFKAYYDSFGTVHPINLTVDDSAQKCANSLGPFSGTTTLTDGSGYKISVDATPSATEKSSRGTIFNAPLLSGTGVGSFTDRNGNRITVDSSGHFYDTLSSTLPVLTVAGLGTPTSPFTFTYTTPAGASASYTVKYATYSVQTNFGCGINEYGANGTTTANLVSEIDLPDYNATTNPNSRYTFTYETHLPMPGL